MNEEDRQLRLVLRHKLLEFPQGASICLVCGASPAGARRVYFEEPRGVAFGQVGAIRSGIDAMDNRIEFDAPLVSSRRILGRWSISGNMGIHTPSNLPETA